MIPVRSVEELESIVGTPVQRVADKVRHELAGVDREWLAAASLVFVATSDAAGNLDVSPKGDHAGFVQVQDATTLVIPDRPGNRRVDGMHNLLADPHIGLVFLIPGRGDTLRVNGRATVVRDPLAIVVSVDEVFFHCSKAFLRSRAWEPESWTPEAAPRRALISKAVERPDDPIEMLDEYYGPGYAAGLV